jgi:uncharacterized protein YaaN involved in tellurite resistance
MTDQTPSFNIQFPLVPGAAKTIVLPPPPQGEGDSYLNQVATTPATREQFSCKALLSGESLEQAQSYAQQLYPQMLNNTQITLEFGKDAISGMNTLIDRLLKEVGQVDIPQLTSVMHNLNNEMRKIRGKYDISDSRVREKLENWGKGIGRFFGQARSLIEVLMEDATHVEQQLDKVKAALAGKEQQLTRNIGLYDQLYKTNEEEIMKVIGAIAVMELVRGLAEEEAGAIRVDPNNQADRDKSERKRLLTDFISNMEVKITEYKNRLFVGWTTSPQVSNMRSLDLGLAQKLDLLMNLTIPVMKGTIVQWRLMIQAQQGAQMERVVAQSANEWLTAYANAGAQVVPLIAQAVQTPSLTPATIAAMAQSVENQAQAIIDAYAQGKQDRAEVDDAIVKARRVISVASDTLSTKILEEQRPVVNELVQRAQRLALPAPGEKDSQVNG